MKEVSELQGILGKILAWNKARLACFSQALIALFITRTVNLSELAVAMASRTEIARNKDATGFHENLDAAKEGGGVAGNARKELESKTGRAVISKQNYLIKQADEVSE